MIRATQSLIGRYVRELLFGGLLGLFLVVCFALPSSALAWSPSENTCMGVNPALASQVVSCGIARGYNGGPNNPQWNVHLNLWIPANATAVAMGDSYFDDFGLVQAGGQDNRTYTGQHQGQCGASATGSWRPVSYTPGSYLGMDLVAIDTCGSFQEATVNFNITLDLSVPTVDIQADGSNGPVVSPTGAVNLSWTSTHATSCTGTGAWTPNGPLNLSGSAPVSGLATTPVTFTVSCSNANSTATDSVTVSRALAPTIASVTPNSGSTLGGTTLTIAGTNFASGTSVTIGGVAATVTTLTATSITAITGPHAAGVVDVSVTNPGGQAATNSGAFTYLDLTTTASGVSYVCAASDPGKPTTEDFEGFVDAQAKDLGWGVTAPEQTTATIRKGIGKPTNALELVDTNATNGAAGMLLVSRGIKPADKASLSFDIQPKQITGRFTAILSGAKGDMVDVYLAPDGTFQYWNSALTTGSKYVPIGTSKYKANEYLNLKLDWDSTAKTFNLSVNGTKLNANPLPYSFANNAGPVSALVLNTGFETDASFTGTYLVDNVNYPGCVSGWVLAVNPQSGVAPLSVTATASLPSKNLLNEPPFEMSDVGAAADARLTRTQKADGTIEITDVPRSSAVGATLPDPIGPSKCWLYDLDQNKINQLQWKQTIPDHAIITGKLSWISPEVSDGRTPMVLGGLGLIDTNGLLHQWLGFTDSTTDHNKPGVLAAMLRNYQTASVTCMGNNDASELTIVDPAQPTPGFHKVAQALSGTSGSATVKIVRDGNHAKLYINDKLIKEMDMQGSVAGVAFATGGLPGYPFGTMRLESLALSDSGTSWDFGDGTAKVLGTDTTIKHTYTKAGGFDLTFGIGTESAKQRVTVTAPTVVTAATTEPAKPAAPAPAAPAAPAPVPVAPVKKIVALISSGGSLAVNLGIAAAMSSLTAYLLLRKRHPTSS